MKKIVWPDVLCAENTLEYKKKSPLNPLPMEWKPMGWVACDDFFSCVPPLWIREKTSNDFCINAYCLSIVDIARIKNRYGERFYNDEYCHNPSVEFLAENHWCSLGFDICDVSLSMSVIHTTQEMQFAEKYTHMWNDHGLIRSLNHCRTLMRMKEFKPHDPTTFTPVEIYTNHFAPIMMRNKISS